MSQSHEPSYYEIALTNRQVLVVFVVLLICVVASFFSGVWIGRRAGGVTAEGQVAELAPQGAGEEMGGEAEPELRKLRFFTDNRDDGGDGEGQVAEDPPLAEIIEEPSSETTLLEDVSGRGNDGEGGSGVSDPPQSPPVITPPITTPAATPPPPANTGEPASGHVVQVFSSTDQSQAQRLVQRLGNGGFPAFISPFEDRGQTKYRVRVGPYRERSRADEAADRLRREFRLDTWVTQLQ